MIRMGMLMAMGSVIPVEEKREIEVSVEAGGAIDCVDVIKDGKLLKRFSQTDVEALGSVPEYGFIDGFEFETARIRQPGKCSARKSESDRLPSTSTVGPWTCMAGIR